MTFKSDIDTILNALANEVEWCVAPATGATLVNREKEHKALAQATNAIIEAVLDLIGEDEKPDTEKAVGGEKGIIDGKRQYEPAYSLRASLLNGERERLRKAIKGKDE